MAPRSTKKAVAQPEESPHLSVAMLVLLAEYEHEAEEATLGDQEAVARAFVVNERLQRLVSAELGLAGLRVMAEARQRARTRLVEAIAAGAVRALTGEEREALRVTGATQEAAVAAGTGAKGAAAETAGAKKAKEALGQARVKARGVAERKMPAAKDAGQGMQVVEVRTRRMVSEQC